MSYHNGLPNFNFMENKLMDPSALPEDIQAQMAIDAANASVSKPEYAPTIGISTDDETIGKFYVDLPDSKGGRKLLEREMEVIILKERRTFSYYNETSKKLELFSNELDISNGFVNQGDSIVLKDNDGNIVFAGQYGHFAMMKKEKWLAPSKATDRFPRSLLKQKALLYVYIPALKEVARLFVNFSSSVGTDPNGGYLFDNPQEHSLEYLKAKMSGRAFYSYSVNLSNVRGEGSIPWRQLKFVHARDLNNEELVSMFKMKIEIDKYCDIVDASFGIKKGEKVKAIGTGGSFIDAPKEEELPTIQVEDDLPIENRPDIANALGIDPTDIDFDRSNEDINVEDIKF